MNGTPMPPTCRGGRQFHRNTKDFRRLLTLLQRNRTRRTKPSRDRSSAARDTVRSLRVKRMPKAARLFDRGRPSQSCLGR